MEYFTPDPVMCEWFGGCSPGWEEFNNDECGCGCVIAPPPAEGEGEGEGGDEGGEEFPIPCGSHCDCPQGWRCPANGVCFDSLHDPIWCCDNPGCPFGDACNHADGSGGSCPGGDPVEGEGEQPCWRVCDCPQGWDCRDNQCVEANPPVYCCASPDCPSGEPCVNPVGAVEECGEGDDGEGPPHEGEGEGGWEGEGEGPPQEGEGEGNQCVVACDCDEGWICSQGWCMQTWPPVWCCEQGICAMGDACQHEDGSMDMCPE